MKEKNHRLTNFLTEDNIQVKNRVSSWEEAIRVAAEPLYLEGAIESSYIEAMIQNIQSYGAYIYLGNGIALPHASPEDGVNRTSFSLLKLDKPVNILNDSQYKTEVIVVLAAKDNKEHLNALDDFMRILDNDQYVRSILETTETKKILEVIRKSEQDD